MTEMSTAASLGKEAAPGVPQVDAKPVNAKENRTLYAPREPVYPKLVHGKYRRIKWAIMIVTLGIYYGLPWLRWDRGPTLPDQAVLLDFAHQRLYFFGLEIWAQEFYYVTGLLILSALALFLVTALAGRVWCGYACPQTVWTDLMIAVERVWQGDRNARMKLAKSRWSFNKAWRIGGTHLTWLAIGILTGGALVFYFRDAPTLLSEFWHFEAPAIAYVFLGLFTATTYMLGGLAASRFAPICAHGRAFRARCSMRTRSSSPTGTFAVSRAAHTKKAIAGKGAAIASTAINVWPSVPPASISATARNSNASNARSASTPATRSC